MTLTLIATAVLSSTTQQTSANHDFYATVGRIGKATVDYRMLALIIVASSLAVVISIITANQLMLVVTTSMLVLVTVSVSSMITAYVIARLLRRLKIMGLHKATMNTEQNGGYNSEK